MIDAKCGNVSEAIGEYVSKDCSKLTSMMLYANQCYRISDAMVMGVTTNILNDTTSTYLSRWCGWAIRM